MSTELKQSENQHTLNDERDLSHHNQTQAINVETTQDKIEVTPNKTEIQANEIEATSHKIKTPAEMLAEAKEELVSSNKSSDPDVDSAKTFAFDINQKIDELQSNIDDLSDNYKQSKSALTQDLEGLQSRTADITEELHKIGELVSRTDANKTKLLTEMEARFDHSFKLLTEELGGIENHIQSQQARLNKFQRELNQSYKLLNERITYEKQQTQELVEELEKENEQQNTTQRAFSEYLRELQEKANTTTDEVYQLNTDIADHRRQTNKHFKITARSVAGISLVLASAIGYLYANGSADESLTAQQVEDYVDTHIEERIDHNNSGMNELYAPKAMTTEQLNQLAALLSTTNKDLSSVESKLIEVQTKLANQGGRFADLDANNRASLENLLNKVSALELSLYGPADEKQLPLAEITIHNNDWIAKQNPSHFVIQLVGVYREKSIIDFANQHSSHLDSAPVSTNISNYRGQNWYNLYFGNFSNFTEAQAALDNLPTSIQRNSPWIRTVSSIQKSVKAS